MNNRTLKTIVAILLLVVFVVGLIKAGDLGTTGAWLTFVIVFILSFLFSGVILVIDENRIRKTYREVIESATVTIKSSKIEGRYAHTFFFVAFELSNGTRKEFEVKQNIYSTLTEGDFGVLTYREKVDTRYFIDFQRQVDKPLSLS